MTERLTAISGCMFSKKTDTLITQVERAEYAGWSTQVFKPSVDNRWGIMDAVRSHSGSQHEAMMIGDPVDILRKLKKATKLVGLDEVQFFPEQVVDVVDELLEGNIRVVVAGLPLDFRGEGFGSMPILLAKADNVMRLTAICTHKDNGEICGQDATRTQRFVDGKPASYNDPVVLIGAEESYAPRCPDHHIVLNKPPRTIIYQAKS